MNFATENREYRDLDVTTNPRKARNPYAPPRLGAWAWGAREWGPRGPARGGLLVLAGWGSGRGRRKAGRGVR